jgi:hypothetical protein
MRNKTTFRKGNRSAQKLFFARAAAAGQYDASCAEKKGKCANKTARTSNFIAKTAYANLAGAPRKGKPTKNRSATALDQLMKAAGKNRASTPAARIATIRAARKEVSKGNRRGLTVSLKDNQGRVAVRGAKGESKTRLPISAAISASGPDRKNSLGRARQAKKAKK